VVYIMFRTINRFLPIVLANLRAAATIRKLHRPTQLIAGTFLYSHLIAPRVNTTS
jgi:hypothetical protein